MNQQQAVPVDHAPIPQVVASYATYVQIRTGATPQITVTGEHAELAVSIADKTLTLAFDCRRGWSLHGTEVRRGEQTTAYSRGQLAEAVAAFLTP